MKKDKELGVVYVLTNDVMPGIVKIGMTKRKDVKARMNELYGTGVPLPFKCEYACSVEVDRCEELEHALHRAFHPYRINQNREFFKIEPYQAVELLKFFDKGASDLTNEVSNDINSGLNEGDKQAIDNEKAKNTSRRPPLNFKEMGIPIDSILHYVKDNSITVRVCSDKKVVYQDEIHSLSYVTQKILGYKNLPQPTPHWEYNGKNLSDIYDEVYPLPEE